MCCGKIVLPEEVWGEEERRKLMTQQRTEQGSTRREFLKRASAGALGLGLLGSSLTASGQQTATPPLCRLQRFSRTMDAKIIDFRCVPCNPQSGCATFKIIYSFQGALVSSQPCDQTVPCIPNGAPISGNITLTLQQGLCPISTVPQPSLWGCEDGTFQLGIGPGGPLITGTLCGTEGFEPDGPNRCCDLNHDEGCLRGNGPPPGTPGCTAGCQLCASYEGTLNGFNPKDPCHPQLLVWTVNFDGVLMCPGICT
jgi:hypothetical protein